MMIYTVTFNPSLDYIVSVENFQLGLTNRTSSELMLPGGKGVNVSTVLMNLGIEADLIVMHPYDRWGFSMMKAEDDNRYWKYVLARFSAYRNVWWSLANEYDLMHEKTLSDCQHYL